MGDTLIRRPSWRDVREAADVLRHEARRNNKRLHDAGLERELHARADALRRVADWMEQEAMRDA
jgi:hypothetical protein